MNVVRWGILGCGDVTEKKSGPGFQKSEHSELVAVMRRNGELAKDYAQRHQVPKWYDNAEQLINDSEVDAIYIATPPAFHKEYTLAVAKAKKLVYVEKPMALNYTECKEMINVCKENNVPLYVAYYRRALPRFLKVKEILDSGRIGEIRFVTTIQMKKTTMNEMSKENLPWRVQPHIAGGGHFFDLASHTLDLLDFFLGPIIEAKGKATNQAKLYEAEDIVSGFYTFKSGVQGIGTWCFSGYCDSDMNEIIGTKGKISFSSFDEKPIRLITEKGEEEFFIEHPPHVQQPLIESVVKDILKIGTCFSTGLTAARTNWVMDEMVKNYYKKL